MLDEAIAKKNAPGADSRYAAIAFRQGDGMALPLDDASFDAVTISFGLRNMADRVPALTEMRRVLRPGGRIFVLEFSQPSPWFRRFYYFYLRRLAPGLARLVTGESSAYEYLGDSIAQFPDRAGLAAEFSAAGFNRVRAQGMTGGIVALHEGLK
jgi:demethylmenaquinone methyltransferase/2-methoxy-6-polyprenyl-1,4-benzoquinol methylase